MIQARAKRLWFRYEVVSITQFATKVAHRLKFGEIGRKFFTLWLDGGIIIIEKYIIIWKK
jgi:hypothetical protein